MAIKVGDHVPEGKFRVMTAEGPGWKSTDEVFKGQKVVLFAVPGAFTPTCHKNHLPGFLNNSDAIKMDEGQVTEPSVSVPTATAILPRRSTSLWTARQAAWGYARNAIPCWLKTAW